MTVFSVSVAVGQACTQAPHDTHGLSKKLPLAPAATRDPAEQAPAEDDAKARTTGAEKAPRKTSAPKKKGS